VFIQYTVIKKIYIPREHTLCPWTPNNSSLLKTLPRLTLLQHDLSDLTLTKAKVWERYGKVWAVYDRPGADLGVVKPVTRLT
jgi:hypothetical protein